MPTVFVVRRKVATEYRRSKDVPDEQDQYLGTFTAREAAEEQVRRLDREAKQSLDPTTVNPFAESPFAQLTTFPNYALRDWLRDADIDPPPVLPAKFAHREQQTWVDWWNQSAGLWTAAQLERVWGGLNLHRLVDVEIVEVDAGQEVEADNLVVFAVIHKHWEYDDSHYCGANDALTVFRTRERAEAEVQRLVEERRANDDYWNGGPDEFAVIELTIEGD